MLGGHWVHDVAPAVEWVLAGHWWQLPPLEKDPAGHPVVTQAEEEVEPVESVVLPLGQLEHEFPD